MPDVKNTPHYKELVKQVDADSIIEMEMGNNRFFAFTKSHAYIVSKGSATGSFFGTKVKTYPLEAISSVDVNKGIMLGGFEISGSGMGGQQTANQGIMTDARNENKIFFNKGMYDRWTEIATKLREQISALKKNGHNSTNAIAVLKERFAKGEISEPEFLRMKKLLK